MTRALHTSVHTVAFRPPTCHVKLYPGLIICASWNTCPVNVVHPGTVNMNEDLIAVTTKTKASSTNLEQSGQLPTHAWCTVVTPAI